MKDDEWNNIATALNFRQSCRNIWHFLSIIHCHFSSLANCCKNLLTTTLLNLQVVNFARVWKEHKNLCFSHHKQNRPFERCNCSLRAGYNQIENATLQLLDAAHFVSLKRPFELLSPQQRIVFHRRQIRVDEVFWLRVSVEPFLVLIYNRVRISINLADVLCQHFVVEILRYFHMKSFAFLEERTLNKGTCCSQGATFNKSVMGEAAATNCRSIFSISQR